MAQNTRAVTLASPRQLVIFGGAVTFSGTVSSKAAGEHVTVVARPSGETAWQADVITTSGGNWSLRVQPRIRTLYQAKFESASSPPLAIAVRPRLTLQKVAPHRFLVVVLAAHSLAGKSIDLARFVPGAGWLTFRQLQLRSIARTDTIAVNTFTSRVPLGTKLRVFLRTSQIAPDYLDGHSNFVVK